jgi:hypothetical protein
MNSAHIVDSLSQYTDSPSFFEYTNQYGDVFIGVSREISTRKNKTEKCVDVDLHCEWVILAKIIREFNEKRYLTTNHTPFSKCRSILDLRMATCEMQTRKGWQKLILKGLDSREKIEFCRHEYDI